MSGTDILVKLSTPPSLAYFNQHYFCDYIEILALAANADVVSLSDVMERFDIDTAGSDENNGYQLKTGLIIQVGCILCTLELPEFRCYQWCIECTLRR